MTLLNLTVLRGDAEARGGNKCKSSSRPRIKKCTERNNELDSFLTRFHGVFNNYHFSTTLYLFSCTSHSCVRFCSLSHIFLSIYLFTTTTTTCSDRHIHDSLLCKKKKNFAVVQSLRRLDHPVVYYLHGLSYYRNICTTTTTYTVPYFSPALN